MACVVCRSRCGDIRVEREVEEVVWLRGMKWIVDRLDWQVWIGIDEWARRGQLEVKRWEVTDK